MELLDLNKHSPEEFVGKYIFIENIAYRIGKLCGEGGQKLLYYLINEHTKTCHFLICFWIDQNEPRSYKDKKKLAERIYGIDGFSKKPILSVMADFLYFPEFDDINNKYHCRFYIQELLGQCPECLNPEAEEINEYINNHEFELAYYKCCSYLKGINSFDDEIMNYCAYAYINMINQKNQGYTLNEMFEIRDILLKMITYEPYYKNNIYQAILLFEQLGFYNLAVLVFERIKDRIFEIYAKKDIMHSVVTSLVKAGFPEKAEKYLCFVDNNIWNNNTIKQHKKNLKLYKKELNSISDLLLKQAKNKISRNSLNKKNINSTQKRVANLYPYFWTSKLNLISYAITNDEPLDDPTDCLALFILSSNELELLYSQLHVGIYNLQRKISVDNACNMIEQYMEIVECNQLPLIQTPLIVSYATLNSCVELRGAGARCLLESIMCDYQNDDKVCQLLQKLMSFFEIATR